MNERLNRFISLLKQIFELDKSDLDFGIYRVMNLRKAQIEEFLTERLPQMVQETLAPFAQGSKEEIRAKMKQIEDSVSEMGMTVDALPDTAQKKQQYLQLQKQLAEGADLAALETDVYSALYSFFNRYYEDGDFISKRRYKEGVYAIPYEGEEVKLYWANQDQYYIKTSENFKDYTFVFDGITVHFRLVDATTEQNNNKESKDSKRTFMLFTEDEENYPGIKRFEYDPDAAEIVIRFVYDIPADKKKKYAEDIFIKPHIESPHKNNAISRCAELSTNLEMIIYIYDYSSVAAHRLRPYLSVVAPLQSLPSSPRSAPSVSPHTPHGYEHRHYERVFCRRAIWGNSVPRRDGR